MSHFQEATFNLELGYLVVSLKLLCEQKNLTLANLGKNKCIVRILSDNTI